MQRQKNLCMLGCTLHCCNSVPAYMPVSIYAFLCVSLSVHDLPACAATLKQSYIMVLRYQRREPMVVITMVYMPIVKLRLQQEVGISCSCDKSAALIYYARGGKYVTRGVNSMACQ